MSITFTHAQAEALLECFGGDEEATITVIEGDETSHSGPGLYAYSSEYPDEGLIFLPEEHDPIESDHAE